MVFDVSEKAPAVVLCGLGLGDEGKGSFVDAWVSKQTKPTWVVRYNGGPQAAHHVVLPDGKTHCFAQFGSGMLQEGTQTLLSTHMLVEPLALLAEAQHLEALGVLLPLSRMAISLGCVVVTPFHKWFGRMREIHRGLLRHGSCGLGVGVAWLDSQNKSLPSLRVRDLLDRETLLQKLRFLQLVKVDQAEQLVDGARGDDMRRELVPVLDGLRRRSWPQELAKEYARLLTSGARFMDDDQVREVLLDECSPCVMEGAQGALLDAVLGFFPFVTPSRTHVGQAVDLLAGRSAERVGILRAYATRHGPGPLPTESAELSKALLETHNATNAWQGPMRIGWFDAVAMRYALRVSGGVDGLAVSCIDRLVDLPTILVCDRYRFVGKTTEKLGSFFELDARGDIVNLRFEQTPSLQRQHTLTDLLKDCHPVLRPLPQLERPFAQSGRLTAQTERFLTELLQTLDVSLDKLACVSFGHTRSDKVFCAVRPDGDVLKD